MNSSTAEMERRGRMRVLGEFATHATTRLLLENQLDEARSRESALQLRVGFGDRFAARCLPAVQKTVRQLISQLDALEGR